MEVVGRHHQTQFGILVGLGTNETVSIGHGNRIFKPRLETVQFMQVGNGIHTTTTDRIVVPGDAPDHDDTWIRRSHHTFHEFTDH